MKQITDNVYAFIATNLNSMNINVNEFEKLKAVTVLSMSIPEWSFSY